MRLSLAVTALALAGALAAACADAQPSTPRSQLGTVTQWVAGTRVDVVYRRPVARGRALFGSLVRWGDLWTPSADSAARVTFSAPVEVNGSALPAGEYGLWMVPDSTSWTVVFSTVAATHHLRYQSGHDALRVRATPAHGDHFETLAFVLPLVDADSAVLQMRWGTTVVPMTIRARR